MSEPPAFCTPMVLDYPLALVPRPRQKARACYESLQVKDAAKVDGQVQFTTTNLLAN